MVVTPQRFTLEILELPISSFAVLPFISFALSALSKISQQLLLLRSVVICSSDILIGRGCLCDCFLCFHCLC